MIVAGDPPDFRTISDFRKRHLAALAELFVQVLKLCREGGTGEARPCRARRHEDQGQCLQAQGDELRADEESARRSCRRRSIAGWRRPRRPTPRRTRCTASRAATRCPTGWPTSRSGWRRSARPRRRWRPRPRRLPRRSGGARPRPRRSARRRPQEDRRQAGQAAQRRARRQGAAQLHRSGEPDHEEQGRLHPGLQRAGRRRRRGAGHRGARR